MNRSLALRGRSPDFAGGIKSSSRAHSRYVSCTFFPLGSSLEHLQGPTGSSEARRMLSPTAPAPRDSGASQHQLRGGTVTGEQVKSAKGTTLVKRRNLAPGLVDYVLGCSTGSVIAGWCCASYVLVRDRSASWFQSSAAAMPMYVLIS